MDVLTAVFLERELLDFYLNCLVLQCLFDDDVERFDEIPKMCQYGEEIPCMTAWILCLSGLYRRELASVEQRRFLQCTSSLRS